MTRLTLRIDLDGAGSIGPGKVRLLELVSEMGSIRSAGTELKMSYARAWKLIQDMNATFGAPVLTATTGGKSGGGAQLTPLGLEIVSAYRAAEQKAAKAAQKEMAMLGMRVTRRHPSKRSKSQ